MNCWRDTDPVRIRSIVGIVEIIPDMLDGIPTKLLILLDVYQLVLARVHFHGNPEAGEELPVVVFESVRYLFNKNLAVSGEKALTGVTLVGISA